LTRISSDVPNRTSRSIFVLAGTREAATLSSELHARGHTVVASFRGLTDTVNRHPFPVRVGDPGGVQGLSRELREGGYQLLVDASHPFASRLSQNAAEAADAVGIRRLRLLRPPWEPEPGDHWHDVQSLDVAADVVRQLGVRRVFLSVGRFGAQAFTRVQGVHFALRSIQEMSGSPMHDATVIVERPPFTVEGEHRLFLQHEIEALVTRNSGGELTEAKLVAARILGIPVVMVQRPIQPSGDRVTEVDAALRWVDEHGPQTTGDSWTR